MMKKISNYKSQEPKEIPNLKSQAPNLKTQGFKLGFYFIWFLVLLTVEIKIVMISY
jgi:hypothetical protein